MPTERSVKVFLLPKVAASGGASKLVGHLTHFLPSGLYRITTPEYHNITPRRDYRFVDRSSKACSEGKNVARVECRD